MHDVTGRALRGCNALLNVEALETHISQHGFDNRDVRQPEGCLIPLMAWRELHDRLFCFIVRSSRADDQMIFANRSGVLKAARRIL